MASKGTALTVVGGMVVLAWLFGDDPSSPVRQTHNSNEASRVVVKNTRNATVVSKVTPDTQIQSLAALPKKQTNITQPKPALKTLPASYVYVRANRLNVRDGPSTSAGLVARVSRGGQLMVTARQGKWLRVDLNGLQAWVHGDYVTSVKTANAPAIQPLHQQPPASSRLTDAQVIQKIIGRSLAGYSGRCPCPYNTMRNGRRCGGRSAYSRPGGACPICYSRDVSRAMIANFRSRQRN